MAPWASMLSVFGLGPLRRRPLAWARGGSAACWTRGGGLRTPLVLCVLAVAGGGYSPFLYYRF